MGESEKLTSSSRLKQDLQDPNKGFFGKVGAYFSYALEALTGGSGRRYLQQMQHYEDLQKRRSLTPAEEARYQDLRKMADDASINDRLR